MQSGPESACTRTAQVSANDGNSSFVYSGLKPSKEYVVMVKAATVVGFGPPAFILKTSGWYQAIFMLYSLVFFLLNFRVAISLSIYYIIL